MKVSDYIVQFFENKGIHDFFGFQGTMIAHFVDSIGRNKNVVNHSVYNEQAAAFAACGYAKATGKCAVAYATSGPGAINLVSGVADAYYDSAPVIFITGQVNTTEYTDIKTLRQQAFQETDVVAIVKPITKYAKMITDTKDIGKELELAWKIANEGRKGPVVLDIPMNIQRSEMDEYALSEDSEEEETYSDSSKIILEYLSKSERPVFILGNGIGKNEVERNNVYQLVHKYKIPVISTLLGEDLLSYDDEYNFGVLGSAYGHRYANWIVYKKADLIISLGASLCRRQTGGNTDAFAKDAQIIRIDIDKEELKRKVHKDEIGIVKDVNKVIKELNNTSFKGDFKAWLGVCKKLKKELKKFDDQCHERFPNEMIKKISDVTDEDTVVVCDVGQHMMWTMQSFKVKKNRILYSGGHGAMGFALPAAIGAYYAFEGKKNIICIAGDGAFQMNIQELQWIKRENVPVCIIIFNNDCLGLIRQQQVDFFEGNHVGALKEGGFSSPNFAEIAKAYGITSYQSTDINQISAIIKEKLGKEPILLEMIIPVETMAIPKTYFGEDMTNQKPYIAKDKYLQLEEL